MLAWAVAGTFWKVFQVPVWVSGEMNLTKLGKLVHSSGFCRCPQTLEWLGCPLPLSPSGQCTLTVGEARLALDSQICSQAAEAKLDFTLSIQLCVRESRNYFLQLHRPYMSYRADLIFYFLTTQTPGWPVDFDRCVTGTFEAVPNVCFPVTFKGGACCHTM